MPPTPESLAKAGTEEAHQIALFCWAALPEIQQRWPELELLFHIPNGGGRVKSEAGRLKAAGVKAGVPDLFLPVKRWGKAGLWIEMKRKPNGTSAVQDEWILKLQDNGYAVVVAWDWIEAKDYLIQYIGGTNAGY